MAGKADYIIKKTEKGPLQRFKNQNLLLKKFGELGLKVYRAITGKRTVEELKKDLALDDKMFYPVIDYMKETEMVELVLPGGREEAEAPPAEKPAKKPAKKEKPKGIPEEVEEKPEMPEEEEAEEKKAEPAVEREEEFFEEIKPIKPVGEEEEEKEAEEKTEEEKEEERREEEKAEEEGEKEGFEVEEEAEEEREEEEVGAPEEELFAEEKKFSFEEPEEESYVEKTIKKKYGDIGIQVYNLIDGQKTAEEIMKEVGISESKLIEILDFLDKEGIIKLEYPGGKKEVRVEGPKPPIREEMPEGGFAPMLETEKEGMPKETVTIPNPVEIPTKLPTDVIKSVQLSANVLIKFKDEGKRVLGAIDGERDAVEIAIKLEIPLYRVYEILGYLVDNATITLKPMTRDVVKKKYGDDAFTIYKKYGREGLMLYELIGKDLSFKDMVTRTTTDKQKALEIFLFIHEVLGIELPLDKELLAKQIGL